MKRQLIEAAAILSAATFAACEGDGLADGLAEQDDGLVEGIPTNLTDPVAVVTSHASALGAKNLEAYTALLEPDPARRSVEPGFRFYPWLDGEEYPWPMELSWGLADESLMVGNMFDPEFVGQQPPVDSIDMDFVVLSQREVEPGVQEVTTTALITVLTGPAQGFSSDAKFILLMAKQPDGYYRIREIREVPRQGRSDAAGVDTATWGRIKSLYYQ